MAQVNFKVQAFDDLAAQGREIRIQAVALVIPTKAQFTVAADWAGISHDWTDETNVPPTGIVWETERDTVYLPHENTPEEFGSTYKMENAMFNPEPGVSDPKAGPMKIGTQLLVPPVDEMGVIIHYRLITTRPDDLIPSGSLFTARYANLHFEGDFQAGKQHEVLLKVYGPQRVDLEIDGLPGWIDGGDVEIPE